MDKETCHFGWSKHVRAYDGWLGMKEPMKDVAACEKFRGGGKQPLIRKYLNGETHMSEAHVPHPEHIGVRAGTWRSETSQYPVEKKKKFSRLLLVIDQQWSIGEKKSAAFRK